MKERYPRRFERVFAALRAAAERPAAPFVLAALRPAAERAEGLRRRAADFACLDNAGFDAADRPSRLSAFFMARESLPDTLRHELGLRPAARFRSALRRVDSEVVPSSGGGSSTPARRAFDKPMAIACFGDLAPCFPSRTWCISSRTNSPAWVVGDLPSRLSSSARSTVFRSGINCPSRVKETSLTMQVACRKPGS